MSKKKIIVGISGASGVIYGIRLLEILHALEIETHLVMSKSAKMTLAYETDLKVSDVIEKASFSYQIDDIGAAIASGSFITGGMIVAPCSMRTLSEIAWGTTSNLLSRAADVVLKDRRRLILMVRETPLHLGHIRSMAQATEAGAIIAPPVPAFYAKPKSLEDMIDHTVGRVLDLFDIENRFVKRWTEPED